MTPEAKVEIIKALVADKHSGFTEEDAKMLEAASDERLESFRVAADARAKEVEKLRAAESKEYTEDEFMRIAPPSLKSLIMRQHKQETEHKAQLVASLKTAQEEYAEAELAAMPIDILERMARLAKVERVDYSGRGVPRSAQESVETWRNGWHSEVYTNPPNPYDEAIKTRRK